MEDIDDLLGTSEQPKKGAKQRALERKQQGIAIAASAARIMQESKLKKTRKAIEDLMGDNVDTSEEVKQVKKAKKSKADNADKPTKAAKKAKADNADKPTKAAKKAKKAKAEGTNGTRGPRGSGKFYFPVDGEERVALCKKVLAKVKSKVSTVELAKQLEVESWKVRLVAVQLAADKQLKLLKEGTRMTVAPK